MILKRIPRWADLQKIKEFYKNCPPGLTVDHIIPLCGKEVSGLHVHTNLQYLTLRENSRKSNKWSLDLTRAAGAEKTAKTQGLL
jgi:5-methylcytosine-specific restriction endonuclease McrA